MPDQQLADVIDINEVYTGCLMGREGRHYAAILRPRDGLFLAKRRFIKPENCLWYAESCLQVPVPYNSEWMRVNPDNWWKDK